MTKFLLASFLISAALTASAQERAPNTPSFNEFMSNRDSTYRIFVIGRPGRIEKRGSLIYCEEGLLRDGLKQHQVAEFNNIGWLQLILKPQNLLIDLKASVTSATRADFEMHASYYPYASEGRGQWGLINSRNGNLKLDERLSVSTNVTTDGKPATDTIDTNAKEVSVGIDLNPRGDCALLEKNYPK